MTQEQVLALLGSLAGLVIGALSLWWRIDTRIKTASDEAKKDAASANLRAEAAHGYSVLIEKALARHEIHAAETFVTKSGLREFREEVMGGIGDVKSSVVGLTTRLDRIIEDRKS